jgi:chromosome segregation ATPase
MGKVLALVVFIVLTFASAAGYLVLTQKITAGERKIDVGEKKLEKGQAELKTGKARLKAGKQELSEGKKKYEKAEDNWFLVMADKLFKGGKGFKEAEKKIAEGDKQVAEGEVKVNAGERQVGAGEMEMSQGREQLKMAEGARVACAIAAVFFAVLSIVLGFWWRRSLGRVFKHTDA